jgi:uncharacterized membrane protein YbaN (DUF454 family)
MRIVLMPTLLAPTALLAHAGHAHEAGGAGVAYAVLAALPFLLAALLVRSREAATWNVVLFSATAGFIHASVTPEHFQEGLAVGLFMLAVTVAQMTVVVAGLNRPSRALWLVTAAGNAAVLAIWVWSRTSGLPVGPTAGMVEPVGFLDLTCAAYEAALIAGCVTLARQSCATKQQLRLAL